ncbi:MAG: hypothetical protein K0S76_2392 [Herbinix sp.]|nr:hypothetical protein [Herbinix sp.]
MSENKNDNKDFEFIREQVIEKKNKKLRKWFGPFCMMIFMAVIFGVIASVTFCLTEPGIFKFLHKEEDNTSPLTFPTKYPDDTNNQTNPTITVAPTQVPDEEDPADEPDEQNPTQVIVERSLDADIDDFLKIYDEIKKVASETNKSIVKISSTQNVEDWYNNPVELNHNTTGVIVANYNNQFFILTSLDRIKDSNRVRILLSEKTSVDAEVLDFESDLNLAVLAVQIEDIPELFKSSMMEATLGESYTVAVGNPVIALGSPNGHPNSMEIGYITSKGSYIGITDNRLDLFNTSINDNKFSDGIIVNMKGEIIGLITQTLKEGINEELNTVIGISKIESYIEQMANQKPRIYFGVKAEDLTEVAKQEYHVDNGIYIDEVLANSPAFDAGVKNGDIILQINEQYVLNSNHFYNTISQYEPEEKLKVKLKRTSSSPEREMEIEVTLAAKENKK